MFKNEDGFSLLEVSVAVAIMAVLTGLGFTIASNVNTGAGTAAGAYETQGQASLDLAEDEVSATN